MNLSKNFPNLTDNEVKHYWQEARQMVQDGYLGRLEIYDYIQIQNDMRA